ncbi:MAG: hypothetical protein V4665_01260 [Patescibacteria group bacterium]
MSWASKRQATYLGGVFLFCALILFAFLYPRLTQAPSCFDTKQNGTETGIDCGGTCVRVCTAAASEPLVMWSRAFAVTGNNYNLVAVIENQNKSAGLVNAPYEFRIYDINNRLIGRRQGSTYLPPNGQFAVFEPRFDSGETEIRSVTFEFTAPLVWVKKEPTVQALPIRIDNVIAGDDAAHPSLTALITNDSVYDLPPFDVVVILYDEDGSAINASKTRKESLPSGTEASLLFTWPEAFVGNPVTRDMIVEINPFIVSF